MNVQQLGIALLAYLTGALAIYAYTHRNRYIDLLIATVAAFTFATSMLLSGLGTLHDIASALFGFSIGLMAVAAVFLIGRVLLGIYRSMRGT